MDAVLQVHPLLQHLELLGKTPDKRTGRPRSPGIDCTRQAVQTLLTSGGNNPPCDLSLPRPFKRDDRNARPDSDRPDGPPKGPGNRGRPQRQSRGG